VAASVNLIQSLGAAFGAAAAGVVANAAGLVEPGGVAGAIAAGFWLYFSMGAFAVVGLLVAIPLLRTS
jgi:hypothetical protein